MIRTFHILAAGLFLVFGCAAVTPAQPDQNGADKWVDFASADYEARPNITYSTANNTELKLDLYLPRERKTPLPTLVLFHGGGWVGGQKEANIFYLLPYLSMNWAVVNVEYRLAKNSPAPAAVEDCRCALRWVVNNAKNYDLDTSKIVLTGTSAGGHLALISAMLPAGNPFDRQCPTTDDTRWTNASEPAVKIAAVVNWFGITDVAELLEGENAKHYAVEWFGSANDRMELARRLSPLTYVRAGGPPVITIHGDGDNVVPYDQAVRLHAALDKAGVPNRLITVSGAQHGGFSRRTMADSYSGVRSFLRKNKILP